MVERLSPTTLNGPIISTNETREVEVGMVTSASWTDERFLSTIAGSQKPRPVMVRKVEFVTLVDSL